MEIVMASFKAGRMGEDVKRELTAILRELKDPRIAEFTTIVRVDLSNDLSHCKVYVSCFEGIEKAKENYKTIQTAEKIQLLEGDAMEILHQQPIMTVVGGRERKCHA